MQIINGILVSKILSQDQSFDFHSLDKDIFISTFE